MIIKTTNHDVFGYVASEAWSPDHGRSFYGTGDSFLWAFEDSGADSVSVYRWTKKNNLFMNSSLNHIAVGSGGKGFGICIDNALEKGTSFSCETYGNRAPLCVSENGDPAFVISDMEIFAFEAHPDRLFKSHPSSYRRNSIFS